MLRSLAALVCLLAGAALSPSLEAAGTRTHVSNAGNDANTAFSCDATHPCRTFAAALTQTTPGGEILAIDSSGYGKVTIDRSVAIIAAPGVFAGIGVGAGGNATGVEIATAGVDVVLRGLTITGQGGAWGVTMSNGATLSIENCVISNFPASPGGAVFLYATATVQVVDSLIRDNHYGLLAQNGATVDVFHTRFLGNQRGIFVNASSPATAARASVSDSVVSQGALGATAWSSNATASAHLSVIRTAISRNTTGVVAQTTSGTAVAAISGSRITGNDTGLFHSGAGATLYSVQDNTVSDNGTDTSGTITALAPK